MTKADMTAEIARRTGLDRAAVGDCIEQFMQVVKDSVTRRESVFLRGFGTFCTKRRKEKKARIITRDETIVVPEHDIPWFKPSPDFKEML